MTTTPSPAPGEPPGATGPDPAGRSARERAGSVRSVERAFELLELMGRHEDGVALSRLAATSGLPVPTIHRLVRTLVASGYALQLPSRRYALGPRLTGLGDRAGRTLEAWVRPPLATLAERTGETANMAMLDRHMVVYVAQVPSSRHTVRMFTEVGRHVFAHCTGVGKALLSQLPAEQAKSLTARAGMPARTDRTITDPEALDAELDRVRAQGFAVDDGEQERGVRCVAIALPGSTNTAISVSGPASRLTRPAVPQVVPLLRAAAEALAAGGG